MIKKTNILFVLSMLILLGITATCTSESGDSAKNQPSESQSQQAQAATGEQPAYDFELETLEGKKVTLGDYNGSVLILDMWDTWCPPCKAEIPHFVELYNEYNDDGLEILGVAFGREGRQAVEKFVKDYNVNYTNAFATKEIVEGFGGIRAIPTTFIIDKNGNIHQKLVGYNDKETFEKIIQKLL